MRPPPSSAQRVFRCCELQNVTGRAARCRQRMEDYVLLRAAPHCASHCFRPGPTSTPARRSPAWRGRCGWGEAVTPFRCPSSSFRRFS
jgi:hypothetical protein